MKSTTLFELNEYLKRVIALNFQEAIWLQCEISNSALRRGHMYLDLVEKNPSSSDIIAQSKATIWDRNLRQLTDRYGNMLFDILSEGSEVNIRVKVVFHERYGLSLQIEDVDLSFTVGRLALQRKFAIEKLKSEGIYDLQRKLLLPSVIQQFAVISSESAAGYIDFITHLRQNPEKYGFAIDLFPVAMQGVNASREIQDTLAIIVQSEKQYDAVVIVRGGGSRIDLLAFDDFELCKSIALFPLPVISGIGHEIDQSVLDEIAHVSLKTPTAVADFLLERCRNFEYRIIEVFGAIARISAGEQQLQAIKIRSMSEHISLLSRYSLQEASNKLMYNHAGVRDKYTQLINGEVLKLLHFSTLIESNDPETILKKGFTITRQKGKSIGRLSDANTQDILETEFFDGSIKTRAI